MKAIQLTQGKCTMVDDEDFERLSKFKWCADKRGNTWYAVRKIRKPNGKRTKSYMHREILKPSSGMASDHKDHNGLNNRKENLRAATRAENKQNGIKRKEMTSRFKGISWGKIHKKWRAEICVAGRQIHLGLFDSEIEAALAYDQAARLYFGEFAHMNFGL